MIANLDGPALWENARQKLVQRIRNVQKIGFVLRHKDVHENRRKFEKIKMKTKIYPFNE